MVTASPSPLEVAQLPEVDSGMVRRDQLDVNGHMNVIHYLDLQTKATITACGEYGLDLSYPGRRGMGLFSIDHHARYLRELRLDDPYSIHVRLLGASATGIHTISYVVSLRSDAIASTLETLLVNVNLRTRGVVRFEQDTLVALRVGLRRDGSLGWTATTCRSIALRGAPIR